MATSTTTFKITVENAVIEALNAHTAALKAHTAALLDTVPEVMAAERIPSEATASEIIPQQLPTANAAAITAGQMPPFAPPTYPSQVTPPPTAQPVEHVSQTPHFVMPSISPVTPPATPNMAPTIPVAQTSYTVEQLMRAGAELMGRGVNAMALLREFGIVAVSELPKEQYGAFATRLRQMGANI